MTPLEERYRRVLRLLPAQYREIWEEDMVSTFLASVATDDLEEAEFIADYGRPGWPEVASIVALAIRLRVGAGAPPRYAAWGEAIRRSVLAGLLVNAAASTVGLGVSLWVAGLIPLVPAPTPLPEPPGYPDSWDRLLMLTALAGLLWLPAFLALVLGHRRAARWLAVAAVVAAMLSNFAAVVVTPQEMTAELSYNLVIDSVLVLALFTFRQGVAPVERRFWLAGLGIGSVLITGYLLLMYRPLSPLPPLDWAGVECVVLVAATAVHVALLARGKAAVWTPALSILAFAVLGLRLVTLFDYVEFGSAGWHPATVPLAIAEAVVVAAAAIGLALLSARTLRRLPATAPDATAWFTSSR